MQKGIAVRPRVVDVQPDLSLALGTIFFQDWELMDKDRPSVCAEICGRKALGCPIDDPSQCPIAINGE